MRSCRPVVAGTRSASRTSTRCCICQTRDLDRLKEAVDIPALERRLATVLPRTARRAGQKVVAPDGPPAGVEPGWTGFRPQRVSNLVHESCVSGLGSFEPDDDRPLPKP